MRLVTLTTTDASGAATTSNVYIVNRYPTPGFAIGFGLIVTGTVSATVQHTFDDIVSGAVSPTNAVWFNHASVAAVTANTDGNYAYPCVAIRLRQNSGSGSCRLVIAQAG